MGQVGRRRFLIAVGALLAAPHGNAQQQSGVRRIGFLVPQAASAFRGMRRHAAFLEGLRALDYVEGRNLAIEWRFAEGKLDRLPGLARELVALDVEVIVAASTPAILAAQRATTSIPIVMAAAADPLRSKLIADLARPEGNTTGVSFLQADTMGKVLEYLLEVLPKLTRLGLLRQANYPGVEGQVAKVEAAVRERGVAGVVAHVRSAADIEPAFRALAEGGAEAVMSGTYPLVLSQARKIAALALQHRMPSAFGSELNVEAGGLLSYGTVIARHFHRAAVYVDRLLRGAKPGDLPVEQASEFELVVNLKTAKALDLAIPPSFLARADRVIE